jgi:hypothetical protein
MDNHTFFFNLINLCEILAHSRLLRPRFNTKTVSGVLLAKMIKCAHRVFSHS